MHCTTLYSFAATAFFAITAQAAPAPVPSGLLPKQDATPSGVFPRQEPQASGVFRRQEPEASGVFQRRQAVPSGIFERQVAPSGVFERQVPAPTGSFQRRAGGEAPYPPRNAEPEEPTTASCSYTDAKAPQYTITVPAEIAAMDQFGGGCPAKGVINALQASGEPVFGFGCKTNSDGGVTLTFSSSGQIADSIDLALLTVSDGNISEDALCQPS